MKIFLAAAIGAWLALSSSKLTEEKNGGISIRWGNWSDWTDCSVTCGGGVRTRERRCVEQSEYKKRCLRVRVRKRKCAPRPCPTPETTVAATIQTTVNTTSFVKMDSNPKTDGAPDGILARGRMPYTTSAPQSALDNKKTSNGTPDTKPTPNSMSHSKPAPESRPMSYTRPAPEEMPFSKPAPESIPYPKPAPERIFQTKPAPESMPDTTTAPEGTSNIKSTPVGVPEAKPGPDSMHHARPTPESASHTKPMPEGMLDSKDATHTFLPWSDWTPCTVSCNGGKRYRTRECRALNGHSDCEDYEEVWCNIHECSETPMPKRGAAPFPNAEEFALGEGISQMTTGEAAPEKSICWQVMQLLMTLMQKEQDSTP